MRHADAAVAARRLAADWVCRRIEGVSDVSHINMGPCDLFAEDLAEILRRQPGAGSAVQVTGTDHLKEAGVLPEDWPDNHVWVEVDGICFDAEAPDGVDTALELPFFVERAQMLAAYGI